ncbi:hypothetical protein ACJIZ3_025859 [Penstemon smallii]|uniref:Uncharacterized protein n=1 Tax=Penstemon smallii TaxID=265156 RepID=A0ABD3TY06_9LAMI
MSTIKCCETPLRKRDLLEAQLKNRKQSRESLLLEFIDRDWSTETTTSRLRKGHSLVRAGSMGRTELITARTSLEILKLSMASVEEEDVRCCGLIVRRIEDCRTFCIGNGVRGNSSSYYHIWKVLIFQSMIFGDSDEVFNRSAWRRRREDISRSLMVPKVKFFFIS